MRLGHTSASPEIRVVCSEWQYEHWRGDFYPGDLPQSRRFGRYAQGFDTVEINNSFIGCRPRKLSRSGESRRPAGSSMRPKPVASCYDDRAYDLLRRYGAALARPPFKTARPRAARAKSTR
jgi:hypothetical protein